MDDEPEIVKELKNAEKKGSLYSIFSKSDTSSKNLSDFAFTKEKSKADSEDACISPERVDSMYQLIAENTSDLICLTTFEINPVYTYVNSSYKTLLGYEHEDLIGECVWDFIHPDDKKNIFPLLKKYLRLKTKIFRDKSPEITEKLVFRIKDKLGEWHYIESTTNLTDDKILFVSKDITERKKNAEEIYKTNKELEEKNKTLNKTMKRLKRLSKDTEKTLTELDQIFNSKAEGMLVIDKQCRILRVNDTLTNMLNIDKSTSLGKKCSEVLNLDVCNDSHCPIKEISDGEEIVEHEQTMVDKNGDKIIFSVTATPYRQQNGEIVGIIESFRDITEIKKAHKKIKEQNIKLKKLDELKSAFLNVTSHELRTPMSSIKGYVQMMLKEVLGEIDEEQEKALNIVLRNTNRLDNLIQDIL
ncbi:MAG: PAS domain S-box protein, partial [Candidatus Thermoplasmatota archaeon]